MNSEKIPYIFVERPSDLVRIIFEIEDENVIGVDLEADSMFHYYEKVCLLQISTAHKNFVIDPLALKDLSPLVPVFADPNIRKVFHGADYDIRSLHRDFSIEVCSLFDTQIAASFLGIEETGLANLLQARFGIGVEKKYQKKDWSKRPLKESMLAYAVLDSVYLVPLAHMLEAELRKKGRLFCVEEECQRLCRVRMNREENDPLFLKFKGAGKLDIRSLTVLEAVLQFRNEMAKKSDRPLFKVLANAQINRIVKEKPKNVEELKEKDCLSPKQIHHFGAALCKGVETAMTLPEEFLLQYPKKSGPYVGPKVSKRIKSLKKWREQRALQMGVAPSLVCTNSQIKSLAMLQPKTQNELKGIVLMRNWQRKLFGTEICALLK